MGKATAKNHF